MTGILGSIIGANNGDETLYVENVFSTYLYSGTGSAQTITNDINLSSKGGLVWLKDRPSTGGAGDHKLIDTVRGVNNTLMTQSSNAEGVNTDLGGTVTAFNSTGFTIGTNYHINTSGHGINSWTFRKAKKFFDIVTYTGNGSSNRAIDHNLGSVPGMIIIKRKNDTGTWAVYHRSLGANKYMQLEATNPAQSVDIYSQTPTSTQFFLGTAYLDSNSNGSTYVAYLFAHDAGGFGLTGTDSVISCGGYTGNGSSTGPSVNLGWEPQWILIKNYTSGSQNTWLIFDNMRGMFVGSTDNILQPNVNSAEFSSDLISPTSTGFQITSTDAGVNSNGSTYIYMAIRRGPMKTPTDATKVFIPVTYTGNGTASTIDTTFTHDLTILSNRNATYYPVVTDRLRGPPQILLDASSSQELNNRTDMIATFNQKGFTTGSHVYTNGSSDPFISWNFKRAPGFFDIVGYTGTGSATTIAHNLGVVPELMIVKDRTTATGWAVYCAGLGSDPNPAGVYVLTFNNSDGRGYAPTIIWNGTNPTSTVFSLGTSIQVNGSGDKYVAYLFATLAGVSKVGSYTGTGTTKQIDCGFTNGARFVLIKRTDNTGDWYVWDSARGIVAGNDPYLLLSAATGGNAEVTNTDYIDPYSAGFEISSTAPAAINANGGTYVYLAIA